MTAAATNATPMQGKLRSRATGKRWTKTVVPSRLATEEYQQQFDDIRAMLLDEIQCEIKAVKALDSQVSRKLRRLSKKIDSDPKPKRITSFFSPLNPKARSKVVAPADNPHRLSGDGESKQPTPYTERQLRRVVDAAYTFITNLGLDLDQEVAVVDGLLKRYFGQLPTGRRSAEDVRKDTMYRTFIHSVKQFVVRETGVTASEGLAQGRWRRETRNNVYLVMKPFVGSGVPLLQIEREFDITRKTLKSIKDAPLLSDGTFRVPKPGYDDARRIGRQRSLFARTFWETADNAKGMQKFLRASENKADYATDPQDKLQTHVASPSINFHIRVRMKYKQCLFQVQLLADYPPD
jgi:hypothetical protein